MTLYECTNVVSLRKQVFDYVQTDRHPERNGRMLVLPFFTDLP